MFSTALLVKTHHHNLDINVTMIAELINKRIAILDVGVNLLAHMHRMEFACGMETHLLLLVHRTTIVPMEIMQAIVSEPMVVNMAYASQKAIILNDNIFPRTIMN